MGVMRQPLSYTHVTKFLEILYLYLYSTNACLLFGLPWLELELFYTYVTSDVFTPQNPIQK